MDNKAMLLMGGGGAAATATSVTLGITLSKSDTNFEIEELNESETEFEWDDEVEVYTGPKRFIDYYPQLAISNNKNDWNLVKSGPCFQHFLKGVSLNDQATDKETNKVNVLNSGSDLAKACFFLNWKKTTNKDGFWYGIIKWEWLIKKENEILVVHSAARNGDTEKTLKIASVGRVYTSTDGDNWTLKHIKTVNKNIDKDKFPEEFADCDKSGKCVDPNKSWGFNPDYEKACSWENTSKKEECNFAFGKSRTLVYEKAYLWNEVAQNGAGPFFGWSFNFDTWWDDTLGTQIEIETTLKNKKGNWSLIVAKPSQELS